MQIHTDTPLRTLTTMKLGGPATLFAEIHEASELQPILQEAAKRQLPVFILGGGSNVIAHDEGFNGLVLRMKIEGFELISDDLYATVVKIGAGENWDEIVKKTVDMRLSGIEAMSGIPGSVGAAPVQNVGAYGQEISNTMVTLEAYDKQTDTIVTLKNEDCEFSYRHSMFRGSQQNRYIITSVTLKLSKSLPVAPFYESLQKYFDDNTITIFTNQIVRDGVLAIRTDKLPDPAVKPNSGSFFKNTIIESWRLTDLQKSYPDLKAFEMGNDTYKISTGWLIQQAGFKGQLLHGIRVNEKNCLVLINESAKSYADLAAARDEIINKVRDTFQIIIEQEPLELTA